MKTGTATTLYEFTNGTDGRRPGPTLLFEHGSLYGVTQFGGADCGSNSGGCGTVFNVNPATGAMSVLHPFEPGTGGYFPKSNLVYHKGMIYGSTLYGGQRSCGRGGCGTLFAISPTTGAATLISKFTSSQQRVTDLTTDGHDLYETDGLVAKRLSNMHAGQLAKFDLKSGHRTVLYKFEHGLTGADGSQPEAPLVYNNGVFYGSTQTGGGTGCGGNGCGTIFQYVP